jgi:hypothetical protein
LLLLLLLLVVTGGQWEARTQKQCLLHKYYSISILAFIIELWDTII